MKKIITLSLVVAMASLLGCAMTHAQGAKTIRNGLKTAAKGVAALSVQVPLSDKSIIRPNTIRPTGESIHGFNPIQRVKPIEIDTAKLLSLIRLPDPHKLLSDSAFAARIPDSSYHRAVERIKRGGNGYGLLALCYKYGKEVKKSEFNMFSAIILAENSDSLYRIVGKYSPWQIEIAERRGLGLNSLSADYASVLKSTRPNDYQVYQLIAKESVSQEKEEAILKRAIGKGSEFALWRYIRFLKRNNRPAYVAALTQYAPSYPFLWNALAVETAEASEEHLVNERLTDEGLKIIRNAIDYLQRAEDAGMTSDKCRTLRAKFEIALQNKL